MTDYFIQAFIYLVAAVIAVPVAKRLGLGSVLGYLIAGVVIGPLTGLVGSETTTIQHFAEFGVVMMLFVVGLELEPRMLWEMRYRLLGLGGLQVSVTAVLVMLIALTIGLEWRIALAIGLILALSSTAIVLQTFNEKGLTKTEGGRASFSVLLFQDIAVIPMLALIPLLALPELVGTADTVADNHHGGYDLASHLPGWAYGLVIIGSIAGVIFAGSFLSRPAFRIIANTSLREMFTATTLLLVIGIAALMSLLGLSPALGTFIAGVVLANSEFRHELETNIEPFKGLLLGLFFITVGAGISFPIIMDNLAIVVGATLGIIVLKALVLFGLARLFKVHKADGWLFTLSLAQAGEFGFVLLAFSAQNSVLPDEIVQILSPVVALSMFLTPALFILFDKVITKRYVESAEDREADTIDDEAAVIIAGIGRFGQIINRFLVANGFKTIVLDHSADIIENVGKINIKSYYGDVSRPDLLHTAGIAHAKMLIVSIDDRARANDLVAHVKHSFPNVFILARAYDRGHGYELKEAGADAVISETYYSAIETGGVALQQLGVHPYRVEQLKETFVKTELKRDPDLRKTWQEAEEEHRFSSSYLEIFAELEKVLSEEMNKDHGAKHSRTERGWTPPPKDYLQELE